MNCKNCITDIQEQDEYCKKCGAKVIRNRLTLKNLFSQFTQEFLNYDNKILKTLKNLLTKPEDVIDSYANGTRKKYVNVVNYFAIALTISGIYIFVVKKFFPEAMDFSMFVVEGQEELQAKNVAFVQEYQSIFMMLYVPIYALMCRVVFFDNKKYNYTELVVTFMYIQAQISIVSAIIVITLGIFGLLSNIVGVLMIPLMILYSAYCLKRMYKLSYLDIVVRTLLFLVVLAITLIIASIVMIGIMLITGDFQEIIKAQKAGIEAQRIIKDSIN